MKIFVKYLMYIIHFIYYRLRFVFYNLIKWGNSRLYFTKINIDKSCSLLFNDSVVNKSIFNVYGDNNVININSCLMNSEIRVDGSNNTILIEPGCKINNSTIVVRGDNCKFYLHSGTTIGSGYFVCMGQNNYISVGSGCMIADDVEIWASDSHPIYDKDSSIINPSKPIQIDDHVWIGKRVIILKGVHIEHDAVIGMGSLVTSDISDSTVNVGVPTKCIKKNINWDRKFIAE